MSQRSSVRKDGSDARPNPLETVFLVSIVYLVCNGLGRFPRLVEATPWYELAVPIPVTSILLFCLALAASPRRSQRRLGFVFSIIAITATLLYGLGESTTQAIYQRSFDPLVDIRFISVGLDLLFPGGNEDLYEAIAIVAFVLIGSLAGTALSVVGRRVLIRSGANRSSAAVGAVLLPISLSLMVVGITNNPIAGLADSLLVGRRLDERVPAATGHSEPDRAERDLTEERLSQQHLSGHDETDNSEGGDRSATRDEGASHGEAFPGEEARINASGSGNTDDSELEPFAVPGLAGADVQLFFVESYGVAAFTNPALTVAVRSHVERLERLLMESGFTTATWYLDSPVSGGFSWIAEATFLTGAWIPTQAAYDEMIARDVPTIPGLLRRTGYFAFLSMPAVVKGEWPEGIRFYGFDDHYYSWDYGYRGPAFSYVAVPDQFSIWKTHQRTVSISRPVFAQHVLVSSHAPFNLIPEFVPEWDSLGDGSIFHERDTLEFKNGWLRGSEFDEGYVAAIEYVLETVFDYLMTHFDGNGLAIVVGDHQPKRPVREADAGKAVPIHLISRNHELIASFVRLGYSRGLVREFDETYPAMDAFYGHFFSAVGEAKR